MTIKQAVETLSKAEPLYRARNMIEDADIIGFVVELLKHVTLVDLLPNPPSPCDSCYRARHYDERDPYHHVMGE